MPHNAKKEELLPHLRVKLTGVFIYKRFENQKNMSFLQNSSFMYSFSQASRFRFGLGYDMKAFQANSNHFCWPEGP